MMNFENNTPIKYSFHFEFTHPKDLVFKVFTSYVYIYVFAPTLKVKQCTHLKNESSCMIQKSSIYTLEVQKKIVIVEVLDIVNTDYFSQIKWKVSIPSLNKIPDYMAIFNLHYISQNKTLFITNYYSYQSPNNTNKNFPVDSFFGNHCERFLFYKTINDFITQKKYLTMQIEIFTIPGELQFCFKLCTNAKIISEMLGEPISCSNNIMNKGEEFSTKVVINQKPFRCSTFTFQIKDIKIHPTSLEVVSLISQSDFDIPSRTNFIKIDYDAKYGLSFISRDKFNYPISEDKIAKISFTKKKMFANLFLLIQAHEAKTQLCKPKKYL